MNEIETNIISKEGKIELQKELKLLVEIERPKVIEEIKEARKQGDLSENAEFDSAREKQGEIEDRIQRIEAILNNAKVISSSKKNVVTVGSVVTLENTKTKDQKTYKIVGTLEADSLNEDMPKISNQSILAQAILEKSINDEVVVRAVKKYSVRIVKLDK